uniref:Conserved plasmid conjugation protein n=2 Tax=Saccharolobus solfataricus TaxID=2287 RepID=S6DG72_SACS2|nr:conserved plasmid conjugation protein [Saccharolobus solfataricus P2]
MSNVFGMDIKRFSVLFIAIIIILSFVASFANIKTPQQNTSVQVGTSTQNEQYTETIPYKYIYNKTITLAPDIQDLAYVRGSYSNLLAPYYNISPEAYILFNFSTPSSNMLQLLLNALAWNASQIAPGPYGALLSVGSSAYVNIINYGNTTLQPFPLNQNDTENYSKAEIIVKYAKNFEVPNSFQRGWSYPPSDNLNYGMNYSIINSYNVNTQVDPIISVSQQLVYSYSTGSFCSGHVTYYLYYDDQVNYNFRYFVDQNGTTTFLDQYKGTLSLSYDSSGQISHTASDTVTVPPGVPETVSATVGLSWSPGHSVSSGSGVYVYYTRVCHHYHEGNTTITRCYWVRHEYNYTYTVNTYYPSIHSIADTVSDTWYEYNVSLPLRIEVYNGTSPSTSIVGKSYSYNTGLNNFQVTPWYTIWSSLPFTNSYKITTHDSLGLANYTVGRTWNAGNLTITPTSNEVSGSQSFYIPYGGGTESINDYYLNFNLIPNITQAPSWIYQSMNYNKYATIDWFYLEQNATLAHSLYEFINHTINESDTQFWKFEYFDLAAEYTMYTFNTTYNAFNNLLELESFYENWSVVPAQILNLSAWPSLKYETGQLLLFNVSRIPGIYNSSVYFNVTGDSETYLVDVYNALGYPGWNKVPFGNSFYFGPVGGRTVYFYLNQSGGELPYLGETLNFFDSNYVPSIFYATSGTVYGTPTKIIAIWNGTAWIS